MGTGCTRASQDQVLHGGEENAPKNKEHEALGWYASFAVDVPKTANREEDPSVFEEADMLRGRVNEFLASDTVLKGGFLTPEKVPELMKPDTKDWSGFAKFLLKRVQDCNALGGPRVHVVPWCSFEALGHVPQFPEPSDSKYILDAERLLEEWVKRQDAQGRVDGRVVCISFFSHRWERPSLSIEEAHPDTPEGKKAQAMMHYGKGGTCPIFSPTWTFEYFFWVDFAGVNQYDFREKMLGITMLSAWMSACSEIIIYNSSTADYEPRAWTRVERMLGYTYCISPLVVYLDDNFPKKPANLEQIAKANPNTFVLDSATGCLQLRIRDPTCDGASALNPADARFIEELSKTILGAKPVNPARVWTGVDKLVFGETTIPLDTEHYAADVKANARLEKIRAVASEQQPKQNPIGASVSEATTPMQRSWSDTSIRAI